MSDAMHAFLKGLYPCLTCHGSGVAADGDPHSAGVWVAFNWDGSAFVPFATELEALRHANSYHMPVKFVEFGDEEWMRR